ncbi:MAG: hypothetical protein Q9N34_00255 [Aquificota bacterium]|nr:hypothetical protein [Aquificota bacterium]
MVSFSCGDQRPVKREFERIRGVGEVHTRRLQGQGSLDKGGP